MRLRTRPVGGVYAFASARVCPVGTSMSSFYDLARALGRGQSAGTGVRELRGAPGCGAGPPEHGEGSGVARPGGGTKGCSGEEERGEPGAGRGEWKRGPGESCLTPPSLRSRRKVQGTPGCYSAARKLLVGRWMRFPGRYLPRPSSFLSL